VEADVAKLTVKDVIEALGPAVAASPSRKPRDPLERELLMRIGDLMVIREDPSRTKVAGARIVNSKPSGSK
jgi:hypothetical protein